MAQSCKTCTHLEVTPNAQGRIVVRSNEAYRCKCPIPDPPTLPDSCTTHFGFTWPPQKTWVGGEDGTKCPTYQKRTKK